MRKVSAILGLLFVLAPWVPRAWAHGSLDETIPAWTFDPWIVVPLVLTGVVYSAGLIALSQRSSGIRRKRLRQALYYGLGWLALVGALVTPLHWLGERLFTAHMVEHEIVMTVAAPLLVLARPLGIFLWGLPRPLRQFFAYSAQLDSVRASWRMLTGPMVATSLHAVAIWAWHVPVLFDAAVTDVVLHRLQHLSFFVTAVFFWWSLLWRANAAVAVGELFITMIHTAILGALMALAPRVLYAAQTAQASYWGFTPLEDQQLAGLVMWIPVGTVYAGAAITLVALWIKRSGSSRRIGDAPTG
jgi:cytochrome c oxidase assembly factor CtaG